MFAGDFMRPISNRTAAATSKGTAILELKARSRSQLLTTFLVLCHDAEHIFAAAHRGQSLFFDRSTPT